MRTLSKLRNLKRLDFVQYPQDCLCPNELDPNGYTSIILKFLQTNCSVNKLNLINDKQRQREVFPEITRELNKNRKCKHDYEILERAERSIYHKIDISNIKLCLQFRVWLAINNNLDDIQLKDLEFYL